MDPLNHSLVGLLVYRFRRGWPAFLLGSLAPDVPLFVAGLIHLSRGGGFRNAYGTIMSKMWVLTWDYWTHSLLVAVALIGIAYVLNNLHAKAFAYGWAIHFVIDFLTHTDDAAPPFWPLSQWSFRSPISYWQVEHFGRPFTVISAVVVFSLLFFWWKDKRRI